MLEKIMRFLSQDLQAPGVVLERRLPIRMPCQVEVEVTSDGATHLSKVTDISPRGLRLEGLTNLKRGQILEIRNPRGQATAVRAQVVWSKGKSAGLIYSDTGTLLANSWIKGQLLEFGFDANKKTERRAFIRFNSPPVKAVFVDGEGSILAEGRLLNVSHGGALIAMGSPVNPEVGVRIVVEATLETPAIDTLAVVRSSLRSPKKYFATGVQFGKPGDTQIKKFVYAVRKSP